MLPKGVHEQVLHRDLAKKTVKNWTLATEGHRAGSRVWVHAVSEFRMSPMTQSVTDAAS